MSVEEELIKEFVEKDKSIIEGDQKSGIGYIDWLEEWEDYNELTSKTEKREFRKDVQADGNLELYAKWHKKYKNLTEFLRSPDAWDIYDPQPSYDGNTGDTIYPDRAKYLNTYYYKKRTDDGSVEGKLIEWREDKEGNIVEYQDETGKWFQNATWDKSNKKWVPIKE